MNQLILGSSRVNADGFEACVYILYIHTYIYIYIYHVYMYKYSSTILLRTVYSSTFGVWTTRILPLVLFRDDQFQSTRSGKVFGTTLLEHLHENHEILWAHFHILFDHGRSATNHESSAEPSWGPSKSCDCSSVSMTLTKISGCTLTGNGCQTLPVWFKQLSEAPVFFWIWNKSCFGLICFKFFWMKWFYPLVVSGVVNPPFPDCATCFPCMPSLHY